MRRRRSDPLLLPVVFSLAIFGCIYLVEGQSSIQARWSCYHHYLAGLRKSAVLPITGPHVSAVSNVQCIFENDGTVYTEIHSALENPYQIMSKKSVNFQVSDLIHLRDIVRRSQCTQTLTAEWKNVPENGKGGVTVVSLLNETTRVEYDGVERQDFLFDSTLAGVRHLIPDDEEYDSNPTLTTTRLLCKHIPQPECVFRGKVEIDLEANLEWSYTFAFRTDSSNQTLLTLRCGSTSSIVRLENDYFLRTDGGQPIAVGHLSDATWHTAVVKHSEPDRHFLKIDDAAEIELAKTISDDTATTLTLTVSVNGDIQLIDPTDSNDDCLVSFGQHRRRMQETDSTRSMCKGCGCRMLTEKFDGLSRCSDDDDGAFSLRRDLDRLSFLHFENAFEIDSNGAVVPAVSVSFKSDSDAGLVLFGYWEDSRAKGRLQVNYHTDSISAIYCHQREEEECIGCTIRDPRGFGRDEWIQTILWGGGDEMHLAVDTSICRLQSINNLSLAEVYAIPQFAQGAAMFVGGTWHEKKRSGLYRHEAAQKYFENTREKAPVLRGCVKDIFTRGSKMNIASEFEKQQDAMLNEPSDSNAFAVKPGCPTCDPLCTDNIRCRSLRPLQSSPMACDCADVFLYNNSEGQCEKKRDPTPIVLSTAFLNKKQIIIDIDNTKAVLSKVWLKFALPKEINEPLTIAEFNSHRETLFNILVDTDGYVQVQLHGQDDERNAARQLNLQDDRVHLLQLLRRTPIGTRHTAKKYDLYIDGWHTVVSDIGKLVLNNISVNSAETQDEWSSVIIHDFGLAYEYDEHFAVSHSSNMIHQVDLHSELLPFQFRQPDLTKTGILDDSLWQRPQIVGDSESSPLESSPYGQVVDFTADIIEPEQLLSARWLLYSFILTILLCLLILICIVCWCVLRRRSLRATDSGSQRTIMRDSPDYAPVKMRPESFHGSILDDDSSIGTDDTDLQAYRDIPSHRVKIYRESMVSILVPSIDQPAEAAIVKRPTSTASEQFAARVSPSSDTSAPLVQVNDD